MLPASASAWSELLHAEVGHLLGGAGVPTLHIKGPTVATWLYEPGERAWGDVDVLVPPSGMAAAAQALRDAGFVERFPGVNRRTSTDHAIAFVRSDPDQGADEVDLHDRFEGVDHDPAHAFTELWRRREPARMGGVPVWFPDLPSRALLVVLNAARDPRSAKARRDLMRLVAAADDEDWRELVQLAARLDAAPALRAGLELEPAAAGVLQRTGLVDVPVSVEWRLRVAGAPRTALRLDELRRMPWPARARAVGRWVVPPPALVRMRDPAAAASRRGLALAYARRWKDGVRSVVPALRALRGPGA